MVRLDSVGEEDDRRPRRVPRRVPILVLDTLLFDARTVVALILRATRTSFGRATVGTAAVARRLLVNWSTQHYYVVCHCRWRWHGTSCC